MSSTQTTIEALIRRSIVVMDGAMGTMIQRYEFGEADFRGKRFGDHEMNLVGNNDLLSLVQPDAIREIHGAYLDAGAKIIETNTFSATPISQADYGMSHLAREINVAAAAVAREAVNDHGLAGECFVAGAIGPTNKTLSISPDVSDPGFRAVDFDEMARSYRDQVFGLLDGGVDLLLVETVFDTLNCKAAAVCHPAVFRGAKCSDSRDDFRDRRRHEWPYAFGSDAARVLGVCCAHAVADQCGIELRAGHGADASVHRGAVGRCRHAPPVCIRMPAFRTSLVVTTRPPTSWPA